MIQIDMPMPTNCLECPACNEYLTCAIPVNGRKWGENDVREFSQSRPEWCPMKEQEAVKPILKRKGRNKYYNDYVCPRCDNEVVYEQNYCSECGVKFIWEGLYHKHLDQEVDAWLEQEARKKNRLPYSPDSNVQWT